MDSSSHQLHAACGSQELRLARGRVLPAELTRINGRALHSPRRHRGRWPWGAGGCSVGQNGSRTPPASYGARGEEPWEANSDISQRESWHAGSQPEQAAAWPGPQ